MSEVQSLYIIYFMIFMFGACIASFISVYVERKKVWGRSMCQSCFKKLNFFELVPVFSYLFLRGKCRNCKTKIPIKLFFGEVSLGLWYLFSIFYFLHASGGKIFFALSILFGSILYLLVLEDFEEMEVSSKFLYFLGVVAVLECISKIYFLSPSVNIFTTFLLPLIIISPFWLIYFLNKNWMGEADPLVLSFCGLFYGPQFALSLLFYSVWTGTAIALVFLIFVKKEFSRGVKIPFLPSVFLASLIILIFNFHLVKIDDILEIINYAW